MDLAYISPSTIPSRSANSVHVAWQCDGLAKEGARVTLLARRSVRDQAALPAAIQSAYGIDAPAIEYVTYYSRSERAVSLRIAALAVRHSAVRRATILSRNLYASYLFAVLQRRPLLFETHQIENGTRRSLQRAILSRPRVITIVISERLIDELRRRLGVAPGRYLVLPDAAPDGITMLPSSDRRSALAALVPDVAGPWRAVCGYFGHLYPGRGLEIVQTLAAARPDVLFLVYGGRDADITRQRAAQPRPNVLYGGFVPHPQARRIMSAVDVLVMPYQRQVSIGVTGQDTAAWMSPLKLFEYMATGVPIISSDLPALADVLRHEETALLVPPDRPDAWLAALDSLVSDPQRAQRLGICAHETYARTFTWRRRAQRLLEAARDL